MEKRLYVKTFPELSDNELQTLSYNQLREWPHAVITEESHGNNIFFLLKDFDNSILSQGQLIPISDVSFLNKTYDIFGIGGIIANEKGKGYGRAVMHAIKQYLQEKKKTGIGFVSATGFYEKCGFLINKDLINRLVYKKGDIYLHNTESTHICYMEGTDKLITTVLQNPALPVTLPREPNW